MEEKALVDPAVAAVVALLETVASGARCRRRNSTPSRPTFVIAGTWLRPGSLTPMQPGTSSSLAPTERIGVMDQVRRPVRQGDLARRKRGSCRDGPAGLET
jgi:hypothetical protein